MTTYIVPKDDQYVTTNGTPVFRFTLTTKGKTETYTDYPRDLTNLSKEQLLLLAKKVGIHTGLGRKSKYSILPEIEPYILFTTKEEAEEYFPILKEPLGETTHTLQVQANAITKLILEQEETSLYIDCKPYILEKKRLIQDAVYRLRTELERQKEEAMAPPAWWKRGDFVKEEDWEPATYEKDYSYLKVIVEATERIHDGYCSGIDLDEEDVPCYSLSAEPCELEETTYRMVGVLPLKDDRGCNWNFQGSVFDPGWRCATGGSGVCNVRPKVRFLSMERVN